MYSLTMLNHPFDFGYTGIWAYGHLTLALVMAPIALLAWWLQWRGWLRWPLTAIAGWAVAAALIVKFVFGMNDPMQLPAEDFLRSGSGRVLDIGCGSGRATVMVLQARRSATVAALDNWSADYIDHNSEQRLLSNAKAAGGAQRVEVKTGDMRSLPFPDASFDGIVSTYAIDHLNREGTKKAMAEAARVLKPGGDFLLAVMNADGWTFFTFGPHFHHAGFGGLERWRGKMEDAGLSVVESGTKPWTVYVLGRKANEKVEKGARPGFSELGRR